jgi:hypothetical protein
MPDVNPDLAWSFPVVIADAQLSVQVAAAPWNNSSTPPPGADTGMNPGRAMCYFYGTILC